MHALEEYGLMHVKLYEDIARHGHIATTYAYPVKVEGRYVMDPSPTPKFDNPKMHRSPALQLFGAGREKRIYAVPPYHRGGQPRLRGPSVRGADLRAALRALRRRGRLSRRGHPRRPRRPHVRLLRHRPLREAAATASAAMLCAEPMEAAAMTDEPLLTRLRRCRNSTARAIGCAERLLRPVAGRSAGRRRRIRLRQDDAAQLPVDAAAADLRHASATACATARCATSTA